MLAVLPLSFDYGLNQVLSSAWEGCRVTVHGYFAAAELLRTLIETRATGLAGVPELWVYREDSLCVYLFDGQHYREASDSPTFPGVPVRQLIPEYVRLAWQSGSSVALRQFEGALRES